MSSITVSGHIGTMRPAQVPPSSRPAARSSAPLRLTRRGRALLLAVLALPLALGIGFSALNGGGATATMDDVAVLEFVRVMPGQTLWGIATELAPSTDPREVVHDLVRFNQLPSADLAAGQQLAIPPKYLE